MKKSDIITTSSGMKKSLGEILALESKVQKKFWLTVVVCSHIRTMTPEDARVSTIDQLIYNCGRIED
jgi:hypothetical protein